MKTLVKAVLALLIITGPVTASDFVVVAALGVVEPAGLEAGQQLEKDALLSLEPWGRVVVRETGGCGLAHVVVGAREHPLAPTEDCSAVGTAAQVMALVQQGMAFAAPLEKTAQAENLVRMLTQEPCVFLRRVSEEGGNARHCPSGYALRGLRCTGDHCDNKDLLCCPYLDGEPDPTAKEMGSRVISEEFPNVLQSKRFLNGLACNGLFCDNILPYQFKSSRLANTRECQWSPWSSEQPDVWLDCGAGSLISGLRCKDDYCGDIGVYCCAAQVK